MHVTAKVGSVITIPVGNTGWTLSSGDPTTVKVEAVQPQQMKLSALKPGSVQITLHIAGDLIVILTIAVVA